MELYQIRQLLAVAEYGSLSAAAGALNVSQPALTRSMQKLEREFNLTLFHRNRNRVELNEAGKIAVEQARRRACPPGCGLTDGSRPQFPSVPARPAPCGR